MGNCVSNTGNFEQPGAQALARFNAEHDLHTDPRNVALKLAQDELKKHQVAPAPPPKPKGPKCSICKNYVEKSLNPWQLTRVDLLSLDMSDDSDAESVIDAAHQRNARDRAARLERRRARMKKRGIELKPCLHVFCGACLAEYIYRHLNIPFDPAAYGTQLRPATARTTAARIEFPMGCPECQVKPGEKLVEISDQTAQLVLGEGNMEEWKQAQFLSTLDIMYCPYRGCGEAFDANDVVPTISDSKHRTSIVQCPRCRRSLCKDCKVVWHERLTCTQFQALPAHERAPEDLELMELARKQKWRRCPKCRAMVELKFGCNHVTCTCKHHFCYTCGADFQHKNGKYRCTGGRGCKVWDEHLLLEQR